MQHDWYTIDQLDSESWAISEYGQWQKVHCYLLLGRERAALIDSGTGIGNLSEVIAVLTSLPIIVVTTHCHWDHLGGHRYFSERTVHPAEQKWMEEGSTVAVEHMRAMLHRLPFSKPAPPEFDIQEWRPFTGKATRVISDGEIIDLGGRELELIHTPGHSPGHVCVLERERGWLATGDILYQGTLVAFMKSSDPRVFQESLDRIAELSGVTKFLPGHNTLDIKLGALDEVRAAFADLSARGKLEKGTGMHRFRNFSIRL